MIVQSARTPGLWVSWIASAVAAAFVAVVCCACGTKATDRDSARRAETSDAASGDASDARVPDAGSGESTCVHGEVAARCDDGLCLIPAGCFTLGTPRDAISATPRSDIEVRVRLTRDLLIGRSEVTRAEWLALGLAEPRIDWRMTGGVDADTPPDGYSLCEEPSCPVVWMSFEDAASYANLRSDAEGLRPCYVLADCIRSPGENMRCRSIRVDAPSPYECEGYRLPTEAEWEYAARAGTRTDYFSGPMDRDVADGPGCGLDRNLDRIGWYCGNTGAAPGTGGGRPRPVGQKEPNGFGLYDVSGNAYEWTNDIYHPLGYGDGPLTDPVGGVMVANDLTPARHPVYEDALCFDGYPGFRVIRGGAFDLPSYFAASGRRLSQCAGVQHSGFRIARTAPVARGSAM